MSDSENDQLARLADQVARLAEQSEANRQRHHETANALQAVVLGNVRIESRLDTQDNVAAQQGKTLERVEHAISGTADSPGLIGRVGRLEDKVGDWKKLLGMILKAVVSLLVAAGGAGVLWLATHASHQ